jgi:hypothetical protein
MKRVEKTVFISYRRHDEPWALAVFGDLTHHGYDVFVDYDGIASGNFETAILENIKARAHFLVLLTPNALERSGELRDWMRLEIEAALDSGRNIVPLMLEGFNFDAPSTQSQLVGTLDPLRRINGLPVPEGYFSEAMERLRNRFLNQRVDTELHHASESAQQVAKEQKDKARVAEQRKLDEIERRTGGWPAESTTPRLQNAVTGRATVVIASVVAALIGAAVARYFFVGPPNSDHVEMDNLREQSTILESQLTSAGQERDQAKRDLGALQLQLSSKNVDLSNIRQELTTTRSQFSEIQTELRNIQNQNQTRIGPNTAINLANILSDPDLLKAIPKTLVLLTSTPDNEQLRSNLEVIFNSARARLQGNSPLIIMGRPNYDKELDAPRLQETQGHGITIHGRNPAGDYLIKDVFGSATNNCFIRRQTAKTPDEFLTYYHLIGGASDIKDVAWIEIGDSPVLNSTGCLSQ